MQPTNPDKNSPTSPELDRQGEAQMSESPSDTSIQADQEANQKEIQTASAMGDEGKAPSLDATQPTTTQKDESGSAAPLGETQPSQLGGDGINLPSEIPDEPVEKPRRRYLWIVWAVAAVLLLALIAGGSAFAGYNSAVDQRTRHQSTLVAGEANDQYTLALQDIALGNFDRARQRLEYIIQLDPNFPDASSKLASVLAQQRITATPTSMPTPTLTPTPDYRSRDDLFAQAQNQLVARDWTGTIDTLLLLRKNYPDYMAVKVDDMLFVALRNRGIDKIAQQHDLEGGNYDLTLAERFGPLDAEARNWRDWADLYIRGASFWDVDWGQAVYYFSQLAGAAPNLMDASGWTASNRYLDALLGYGDWYASQEQWCDAQTQFDTYMSMMASQQVEPTAAYVADKCYQALNPPAPPAPVTETPAPTETPGAEATAYPAP
jgi:tetratricopeptide (TPR) repeat protein